MLEKHWRKTLVDSLSKIVTSSSLSFNKALPSGVEHTDTMDTVVQDSRETCVKCVDNMILYTV